MAGADVQPAAPVGATNGVNNGRAPVFGDFDSESDDGSCSTTSDSDHNRGEYDEVWCGPRRHGSEWLSRNISSLCDEMH